jgi:hypothetical protein
MRCLERRCLVADYEPVTYPTGDQAERRFERIIGNSAALESVLDQVEQVALTDSTVLTEGETGTGKERYRAPCSLPACSAAGHRAGGVGRRAHHRSAPRGKRVGFPKGRCTSVILRTGASCRRVFESLCVCGSSGSIVVSRSRADSITLKNFPADIPERAN